MSSRYHTIRQHKKRPVKGEKQETKPNAFKTEAKAKDYAERNGLKDYRVEAISEGKFKIRERI